MRFLSVYLQNYIGIYNGMGLTEIYIDFSICKNRTIVIRGDNGSGKSTLMNAISVFPDSNDQFIPNKHAKKEVVLQDNQIIYKMTFIHGIKSNGQRETTKAYIEKNINGVIFQLNENGNVTSYKDILMEELGMDPSFESLSHLSTDDRGIADKKPVERKRFVSATLSNLEVYNDIYKSISKQCQQYKNLINSIASKLGTIGDSNTILSNVNGIDCKINELQNHKLKVIQDLATAKAKIDLLDPDGSIQDTMKRIEEENLSYGKQLQNISTSITALRLNCGMTLTEDIFESIENIKTSINNANISNQLLRGKIEIFLKERESESIELTSKIQRLKSLEEDWRYDDICNKITNIELEIKDILQEISISGIDPSKFSKETYIAALETINRISEAVSSLKDRYDYSIIDEIVNGFISNNYIPSIVDLTDNRNIIKELEDKIRTLEIDITRYEELERMMDVLDLRPEDCKNDSCPFIAKAVSISLQDPINARINAIRELKESKESLNSYKAGLELMESKNSFVLQFSNFIRDIKRNVSVIIRLPGGDIFNNIQKFIDDVFHHNLMKYFDAMYEYIYLANYFDQYKALNDTLSALYDEKKSYDSKHDIIDEIQKRIEDINQKLSDLDKEIIPIQGQISSNDKSIIDLQNRLSSLQVLADKEREYKTIKSSVLENEKLYKSNIDKISKINKANSQCIKYNEMINILDRELSPLQHERDRLNHQMRLIDDYNKELDQLNNQYKTLEMIRYYSSPRTGIQLVYMELYMGSMIAYANQLLELFFNGRFKILPFIINESEFRIPCAGDGLTNDDISSMSSAQIAMISMVISFAILYTSSSKYNILKLDEIDGPLDGTNRMMFSEVLSKAMDMLHVEQTIMISHNSEFDENKADLIILKTSDPLNNFHGNIIWKY